MILPSSQVWISDLEKAYLSVCLCIFLCLLVTVYVLFICFSVCLSVCVFAINCLFVYLPVCLSVCACDYLLVFVYLSLSVCLFECFLVSIKKTKCLNVLYVHKVHAKKEYCKQLTQYFVSKCSKEDYSFNISCTHITY